MCSNLQIIQAFFYSRQLFSVASAFLQIFKSFKLSFIQDSYSVWRQPSFKSSNHSSFLLFIPAIQYGVSLPSNLQIIQAFFYSRQLFSMASAFLQTFNPSNHSKYFFYSRQLFSMALAFLQIIQAFFYSRQLFSMAS